jgi:hypothetical protein
LKAAKLDEAALWLATGGRDLATGGRDKGRAAVPQLIEKYGLTPGQACEAIRQANLIKARAI